MLPFVTGMRDVHILHWKWKDTRGMLPCPGGVMVMVCAVNSSSKYRVSVSEVTWGLNGGTSCWSRAHTETYQYCPTVVLLLTICKVSWKASYTGKHPAWAPGARKYLSLCHCSLNSQSSKVLQLHLTQVKKNNNFESIIVFLIRFHTFSPDGNIQYTWKHDCENLHTHLLLIYIFPFNSCKELVLHDFLGIVGPSS